MVDSRLRPLVRKWRSELRLGLANAMPSLGVVRRFARAALDAYMPARNSYSQHGEDMWFLSELERIEADGGIYVEVGANHPTAISNTYLLYRHGMRGILIEPNANVLSLSKRFRPGDVCVCCACDETAAVRVLGVTTTPVLSFLYEPSLGSCEDDRRANVTRQEFVPTLRLDDVLRTWYHADDTWIFLLSIDTEGTDIRILNGSSQTLETTMYICIEVHPQDRLATIAQMLGERFVFIRQFGCNAVFQNVTFRRPARLIKSARRT